MRNESRTRKQVAQIAAQLMYERHEKEYLTAKRKALRILRIDNKHADLPSNREIREEILALARIYEGDEREGKLRGMRLAALDFMIQLESLYPRLLGSVLTGHVRKGSDIDIHVFGEEEDVEMLLSDMEDVVYEVEHKNVVKHGEEREFVHFHVEKDGYHFELTLYPIDKLHYNFKSSITGKTMERATIGELEEMLEIDTEEFEE